MTHIPYGSVLIALVHTLGARAAHASDEINPLHKVDVIIGANNLDWRLCRTNT